MKTQKKSQKSPYLKNKSASRSPIKKIDKSITVSRFIKGNDEKWKKSTGFPDRNEGENYKSFALASKIYI